MKSSVLDGLSQKKTVSQTALKPSDVSPINDVDSSPAAIIRQVMERWNLTQTDLARSLGVSKVLICKLLGGAGHITPNLALRLGKITATNPRYWLDLQACYYLSKKQRELRSVLDELEVIPSAG